MVTCGAEPVDPPDIVEFICRLTIGDAFAPRAQMSANKDTELTMRYRCLRSGVLVEEGSEMSRFLQPPYVVSEREGGGVHA